MRLLVQTHPHAEVTRIDLELPFYVDDVGCDEQQTSRRTGSGTGCVGPERVELAQHLRSKKGQQCTGLDAGDLRADLIHQPGAASTGPELVCERGDDLAHAVRVRLGPAAAINHHDRCLCGLRTQTGERPHRCACLGGEGLEVLDDSPGLLSGDCRARLREPAGRRNREVPVDHLGRFVRRHGAHATWTQVYDSVPGCAQPQPASAAAVSSSASRAASVLTMSSASIAKPKALPSRASYGAGQ